MGISRIEQVDKKNFGYYVRLVRQGKQYAKFFADKKFGSKASALEAAEQHLQELLEKMPARGSLGRKTYRNKSGYAGVALTRSKRRSRVYEYWQAWFGSGLNRKSVKFSVNKYGFEEARERAIAARKNWELEYQQNAQEQQQAAQEKKETVAQQ